MPTIPGAGRRPGKLADSKCEDCAPQSLTTMVVVGQEPGIKIEEQSLGELPTNPKFAPLSVNIYEFTVNR